jgi:hypothetical protein
MKSNTLTRRQIAAVRRFCRRHGGKTLPEAVRDEINEIKETSNYAKQKQKENTERRNHSFGTVHGEIVIDRPSIRA